MRKGMALWGAILCCALMLTAGCAKQEVVKKETPPPEMTATTPPPAPTPPPIKEEPVKQTPITRETVTVTEETVAVTEDAAASRMFTAIYFDFDAYTLSSASRDSLAKNSAIIKKNKGMKVQIQGNCDERGSDAYNLALGEKRAKAAFDYLVTLGVPAGQLSIISYGKERPLDPGHDEAAWAKNRRDDFVVLK